MKKLFSAVALIFLIIPASFSQAALVQRSILDGKVELLLPVNFQQDKDGTPGLFSGKNGPASLQYQLQPETLEDNDIPAFTDDQLKLAKQDDETFSYIDDGIHLQDGKNIGYLKFSSMENGKKYFNYTFFISVQDKPLIFRFSCLLKDQKKWEADADKIANSIRVK